MVKYPDYHKNAKYTNISDILSCEKHNLLYYSYRNKNSKNEVLNICFPIVKTFDSNKPLTYFCLESKESEVPLNQNMKICLQNLSKILR